MGLDLNNIFTGVRFRCPHHYHQNLINDLPGVRIAHMAIIKMVALKIFEKISANGSVRKSMGQKELFANG
jgi:hypothetical protein